MPKNLPIGVDNFADLLNAESNYAFADKTLFIKEIIDDQSMVVLIMRPRRWGKTLNMSMLQYFFAARVYGKQTAGMFDPYAIAQVDGGRYIKQHQGQYPVIFVSFKDVKGMDFAGAVLKVKGVVQRVCREHGYLSESKQLTAVERALFNQYLADGPTQQALEDAFAVLSQLLYKHHGQLVYILIDEYDTPLNAAYKYGFLDSMTAFMKNLLSATLKGNEALKKGVLTGILRISKDSMLSGLNNLKVFTILNDRYKDHFGFTNAELDQLFALQGLSKDEDKVKNWYNGYQVGGLTLYNPWSIINCLDEKGELRPYWVNTADDSMLREILQEASVEVKVKFQQLLEGKAIEGVVSETIHYEDIKSDEISIWSLLLYTGYLTVMTSKLLDTDYICQLTIPNQEVLALYKSNFIEWLKQPSRRMQLKSLLEYLVEGSIERFVNLVSEFLLKAASIHDYAKQPEAFYHGFMLALTAGLIDDYVIESNPESGYGRPDLLFIPKIPGKTQAVILEFKPVAKGQQAQAVAHQALEQIELKVYNAKLKQYPLIKTVLCVGLAFDGKQVFHASRQYAL